MLVFTLAEYGGLNQMTSRLRFFFSDCSLDSDFSYFNFSVNPLRRRASSYSGTALLNFFSLDDMLESLLATPWGICFNTAGGWLDLLLT